MAQATKQTFDEQRPENISDNEWSSLKAAVQEAKLLPSPTGIGGENSKFGASVSVDGSRALIGAPNMLGHGVVYVMDFVNGNWVENKILMPSDGEEGDKFGTSVSLSGDRALIGASADDDNGVNSGSVYVYDFDGTSTWSETKLTASDGATNDSFGVSVSLWGDRGLVGASNDDSKGSVYIFDFDGASTWSETKLIASDGGNQDFFGYSVSLSGDRVLVGAYRNSGSGAVYIFDFNGVNFWSETKLTASDGEAGDSFGRSVSLSGNRALVGARLDDNNGMNSPGSVYVFDYDGVNTWNETKLTASDQMSFDYFGYSVSLSGDRVLVGSYYDDDNGSGSGSVYVYDFDGVNTWSETKLIASDGAASDQFGWSVSLSGNRALVGALQNNGSGYNSGSGYIYDFDGISTWNEAKLLPSYGAALDNFGISVSLSGDRALVGASRDDENGLNSGAAYIFEYDGVATWNKTKLTASDGAAGDNFGSSVSLSGDRALIGADKDSDDGTDSGSVYIFDFDGVSVWSETKITPSDGIYNKRFGFPVSLSGDRALVGARGDNVNGTNSGSVYIFDFDGTSTWNETKLVPSDGASYDVFGGSVAQSGDRVLVGARGDDDNGNISGSVYIFEFDGFSNWNEIKLTASDGAAGDRFGYSVSLSGERALVSAYKDDDNGTDSGSVYIFDFDGFGTWVETKLTASDGADNDQFGTSVSLSGNRALVGAKFDDDNGNNSGSVYIYDFDGVSTWSETKLTASDGAAGDQFGRSVSFFGDRVLIGSYLDDENGFDSGSAYIYLNPTFSVGGNITGLATGNTVELANNTTDAEFFTNGAFSFATKLADAATYAVTVSSSPTTPNQICTITGGSNGDGTGVINSADVNDIMVVCENESDLIFKQGFE